MNNVHPRILESVISRLPKSAVIESASAESLDKAVFMVNMGGAVRHLFMDKVDTATYLAGQSAEVLATEGDTWESVMLAVSEKYRLYLVPGVDYEVNSGNVNFEGCGQIMKAVAILPESISLKGMLIVSVRCKVQYARPTIAVCCPLSEEKTQLALVSKVFPTYDVIVIGAGGLGPTFVRGLVEQLTNLGIEYVPSEVELGAAEVVELIHDGVSDIAVIRTADDHLWFVRYRLLSASQEVVDS